MLETLNVLEEYVEAEVYKVLPNNGSPTYLVKVCFTDIGLYINSIRVQESVKYPEKGMWVQLPSYKAGMRWYKVIEFDGSSPMLALIEKYARQAVEEWRKEDPSGPTSTGKGKEIDLDTIPF